MRSPRIRAFLKAVNDLSWLAQGFPESGKCKRFVSMFTFQKLVPEIENLPFGEYLLSPGPSSFSAELLGTSLG